MNIGINSIIRRFEVVTVADVIFKFCCLLPPQSTSYWPIYISENDIRLGTYIRERHNNSLFTRSTLLFNCDNYNVTRGGCGYCYWQDAAKRQTAGIKFTHRPKIRFFAPQGRLVVPIHVKLWHGQRAPGSACLCKISTQSAQGGGGNAAQNIKNFQFLVKSRLAPEPISKKNVRVVYTPNYHTLVFQIWHDSLQQLQSYCWETARRSIRPNFSVHPAGKTMRWIKKWLTFFDGLNELPCKVWGRSYNDTTIGAKTWCLYVCF